MNVSGVDTVPILSQVKSLFQWFVEDPEGAAQTQENYKTYSLIASQVCSLLDLAAGKRDLAWERQRKFADVATRTLIVLPESIPVVGHAIGVKRCCGGAVPEGVATLKKATRSCVVLTAGMAAFSCVGPVSGISVSGVVVAAAAGTAAGLAADAFLALRPSVPRPLSSGERFDLAVLRLFDALRGIAGMDLVVILWPERVVQLDILSQPLTVGDVAALVGGGHQGVLDGLPTGAIHTSVLLKTSKGRWFVTERIHDGRILLEERSHGTVASFAQGHDLPLQAPEHVAAARPIQEGQTFVSEVLQRGPHMASVEELARIQSNAGYDLMRANCQHYAREVYNFVVGRPLEALPNETWIELFKALANPVQVPSFDVPSVLSQLRWAAYQVPADRLALDAAVAAWPGGEPPPQSQAKQVTWDRGAPTEEAPVEAARRNVASSAAEDVAMDAAVARGD